MKTYKDLSVWQRSIELVEEIYKITNKLPKQETFGLASQMQRAAVAIPSNIAEGAKRNHKLEYVHFLSIANGSAAELETQLMIAQRLYSKLKINFDKAISLVDEVLKMLYSLMASLKR